MSDRTFQEVLKEKTEQITEIVRSFLPADDVLHLLHPLL